MGVTPVTKATKYDYIDINNHSIRYESEYDISTTACHIMPIVGYNDEQILFLDIAQEDITLKPFLWKQLLEIQDKFRLIDLLWLD